jgi:hypothetical protein
MSRKFYSSIRILGIIGGLSFSLNHGIMEYWNDGIVGFLKDIIHFKFCRQNDYYH